MSNDIPTSVYVEFIDRTIAIHWAYHATLMIVTWFVIVPIGVIAIRFFQAKTDAEWHRTWGRVNMVDDSLLDPVCGHISALDVWGRPRSCSDACRSYLPGTAVHRYEPSGGHLFVLALIHAEPPRGPRPCARATACRCRSRSPPHRAGRLTRFPSEFRYAACRRLLRFV
jgi:hypothetical protein